jgi:hypothetical protein
MMKLRIILFTFVFLVIQLWHNASAENLKGKLLFGTKGGLCSSLGGGFDSENIYNGNYGVGISAEYFFWEALSGGLAIAHNSFEGKWQGSNYFLPDNQLGYTGWDWTNMSIFTRFVMGPGSEASPYLVAGMGLYFPRVRDKIFRAPDTVYAHTSYGKGEWGYHLGCGVQYLISPKLLVFFEIPITYIYTKGLETHWTDLSHWIGQEHMVYGNSKWVNVFAGISFLW